MDSNGKPKQEQPGISSDPFHLFTKLCVDQFREETAFQACSFIAFNYLYILASFYCKVDWDLSGTQLMNI